MSVCRWRSVLVWVPLMVICSSAGAAKSEFPDAPAINNPNVEEYIWKEGKADLPPYPKEQNLQPFTVDQPQKRFDYFIDRASLVYGEDSIVRYTLVVRSTRGSENVTYEGMRCQTKEYKAYAFGNGKGGFRETRKSSPWRAIDKRSHSLFRHTLFTEYLCSIKIPNVTAQEVLNYMQYDHRRMSEDRI